LNVTGKGEQGVQSIRRISSLPGYTVRRADSSPYRVISFDFVSFMYNSSDTTVKPVNTVASAAA
jgi:hypothetical protein